MILPRTQIFLCAILLLCFRTTQPDCTQLPDAYIISQDLLIPIDLENSTNIAPLQLDCYPKKLIIPPSGEWGYVFLEGLEEMKPVHLVTGKIGSSIPLPAIPLDMAIPADEKMGYLIFEDSKYVAQFSDRGVDILATLEDQPSQILLSPDDQILYVSYTDSKAFTRIHLLEERCQTTAMFENAPTSFTLINQETIAVIEENSSLINLYNLSKSNKRTLCSVETDKLKALDLQDIHSIGDACYIANHHSNEILPINLNSGLHQNPLVIKNGIEAIAFRPRKVFVDNTVTSITQNSPNPSVLGETVTFKAAVSGGTNPPTGTVTFFEGTTSLGTSPITNTPLGNVATFTISNLSLGNHSITAVYNGDADHAGSTSSPVNQQVNNATTTALSSLPNPSIFGQQVTFSATVSVVSPGTGTPSGNVTFFDGANVIGTGVLNGSGVATFSTSILSVGSHSITAAYEGATNYSGSSSPVLTQVVNQASTTTSLNSSLNPSIFGQQVTFNAVVTVNSPGTGIPTGTVSFFDGANLLGTGALDGSGAASFSTTTLDVGSHAITAVYQGDSSYIGSPSSILSQVVNQATTNTSLSSSPNPSVVGQSVTLTALVSSSTTVPSGSVTFFDGVNPIGSSVLDVNGVARISINSLSIGSHAIQAVYSGNAQFTGSSSAILIQSVTVPTLYPPTDFKGVQIRVKFLNETDYVNILTWKAPIGGDLPVSYRIYRDASLTDLVTIQLASQPLKYEDHQRKKNKIYTYYIVSIDTSGNVSQPVSLIVPPNSKR